VTPGPSLPQWTLMNTGPKLQWKTGNMWVKEYSCERTAGRLYSWITLTLDLCRETMSTVRQDAVPRRIHSNNMRIGLAGLKVGLGLIALAGVLLCVSNHARAGSLNGMDDPDRVPGKYVVALKRDHILSLNNPALTDLHEIATKSEKWKKAKANADGEVAQMVFKLKAAHPNVRISAVTSDGKAPGFVLWGSDEDAKAIANEDDVAEVDADILLKNVTLNRSHSPAPQWGLIP